MESLFFHHEPYYNQVTPFPSYLMLFPTKTFKIVVEGGVLFFGTYSVVFIIVVGVFIHYDDVFFRSLKKEDACQLFDVVRSFVLIVFEAKDLKLLDLDTSTQICRHQSLSASATLHHKRAYYFVYD